MRIRNWSVLPWFRMQRNQPSGWTVSARGAVYQETIENWFAVKPMGRDGDVAFYFLPDVTVRDHLLPPIRSCPEVAALNPPRLPDFPDGLVTHVELAAALNHPVDLLRRMSESGLSAGATYSCEGAALVGGLYGRKFYFSPSADEVRLDQNAGAAAAPEKDPDLLAAEAAARDYARSSVELRLAKARRAVAQDKIERYLTAHACASVGGVTRKESQVIQIAPDLVRVELGADSVRFERMTTRVSYVVDSDLLSEVMREG